VSEIIDTLIDGLLEREADTGSTVRWFAQTMPCSGGSSKEGKTLDIGGFRPNAQVVLVLRIAVLDPSAGRPRSKQTINYVSAPLAASRALLIDTATTLYDAILVLECNDPNQGS
jgi:hypothetical protein